jgi:hypothetical protein
MCVRMNEPNEMNEVYELVALSFAPGFPGSDHVFLRCRFRFHGHWRQRRHRRLVRGFDLRRSRALDLCSFFVHRIQIQHRGALRAFSYQRPRRVHRQPVHGAPISLGSSQGLFDGHFVSNCAGNSPQAQGLNARRPSMPENACGAAGV